MACVVCMKQSLILCVTKNRCCCNGIDLPRGKLHFVVERSSETFAKSTQCGLVTASAKLLACSSCPVFSSFVYFCSFLLCFVVFQRKNNGSPKQMKPYNARFNDAEKSRKVAVLGIRQIRFNLIHFYRQYPVDDKSSTCLRQYISCRGFQGFLIWHHLLILGWGGIMIQASVKIC